MAFPCEQDGRRVVGQRGDGGSQVVDAGDRLVRERHLVAQAGDPEGVAVMRESDRIVLEDANADVGERAMSDDRAPTGGLTIRIAPPVVVSEDAVDTERGTQLPRGLSEVGHRALMFLGGVVGGTVVAEQHDQVGVQRVRGVDDLLEMFGLQYRVAVVDIGNRGDGQRQVLGPAGRRRRVRLNPNSVRPGEPERACDPVGVRGSAAEDVLGSALAAERRPQPAA